MERKKLTRSENDKMIAGVAGGLGEYLGIDSTIIRLVFVLLAFAGGNGVLIYLVLWLVMPLETLTGGYNAPIQPTAPATPASPVVTPEPETRTDNDLPVE